MRRGGPDRGGESGVRSASAAVGGPRRRCARLIAAVLAAALVAAAALPAVAAACPKTSLPDVEDEVICPVCGTPLALAGDAPQAERQRAFIRERVDRCESKPQIKAALEAEFGSDVLGAPSDEGANLAAYLVPALALALAGGATVAAALRWRRARTARGALGGDGASPVDGGSEGGDQVGARPAARPDDREPRASPYDEPPGPDPEPAPLDPAAAARLEADLRRYDP